MADASIQISSRKRLLLCLTPLVLLALLAFWYAVSPPPAIQVRFICTTKQDSGIPGTMRATFEIENRLKEPLSARGALSG
jgi:hypothetical protein